MAKTSIQAEIGLDTTKFQRGLARSKKSLGNFAKSGIGQMVKLGAAFAGIGLVKGIINLGTSAAETASKFEAVFGPAADKMNERILELKKSIPATTAEMQNALATFGAMGKAFGLNSEAANEFSVNMTKIAGDLASFHNLRPEEAFNKIQSAISGEFEPMKQLGIVINEATLKQEALTLGTWDGIGAMSAAQKALTVQSLLIKQMGVAQGDAAATAESAANQIKFLQAKLKDTGAEIGNTVLPAVVKLVGWVSKLANVSQDAAEKLGMIAAGGRVSDDPLDEFKEAAKQKLSREGRLLKSGNGGVGKHAQLLQIKVEAQKLKDAHDEKMKMREDEVKVEDKVTEATTDPARQKAADDYLISLQNQIKAAGKLEGLTKATTAGAGGKSEEGGARGTNIEQGEFEARNDFLRRREKARVSDRTLQDKLRQQAQTGESAGITDQLVLAAQGGGTSANPAAQLSEKAATESAASQKQLNRN